MIIYIVSSMTTVYPQMTILCVFVLCFLSVYTVYRVLTVYMIGAMSETEILSCYAAMVSLLWFVIVSNQSHLERPIIFYRKFANSIYVFPIRPYIFIRTADRIWM